MRIESTNIPENFRRCMAPEDRKPFGKAAMTNDEANAKQEAESERQLQQNISALFRLRGIVAFYQRMDKRTHGPVGTPDYLFSLNGKPCAIEVKLPGKVPTPEQALMHHKMMVDGWIVRIVHSEQEFKQAMEEMGR